MVQVRERRAVQYAEPDDREGLGGESFEESDYELEVRLVPARKKATPSRAPRPRKRPAAELQSEEGTTLLAGFPQTLTPAPTPDIVKKHGASIAVAAKDWVDRYKADRAAATAELLTLLLQARGAPWRTGCACGLADGVTAAEVEEGEVDALKEELDKKAMQARRGMCGEGLEDPFKAKGQKGFRGNYLELWDKAMRDAHAAGLLGDQFLLDRLVNMVIALNTSVVRDFRRVATLTAAQLVSSLILVIQALTEARNTAQRQLAAEEKRRGGGAAERAAAFRRTVERSHSAAQELQSYIDALFQGVFSHRFRLVRGSRPLDGSNPRGQDCCEEIRACCIEGIGAWTRLMPSVFLTDQYLKYLAWALSDKDAGVRRAAVGALLALYSQRDNVGSLHDFTERFLQRFTELLYDRDEGVAVRGVQLITLLVQLEELPAENVREVYRLLGDESHAIRHAASELVASLLEGQGAALLARGADPAPPSGSGGKAASVRKRHARKATASAAGGSAAGHSAAEVQLAGLLAIERALAEEAAGRRGLEAAAGAAPGVDEAEDKGREAEPLARDVVAQVVDALFDRVPVLGDWKLMVGWLQQDRARELLGEAGAADLARTLHAALVKATGGQLVGAAPERRTGAAGRERAAAAAQARQEATLVLLKELPGLLRKAQTQPEQAAALVACIDCMQLEVYALKREERAFSQLAKAAKDTLLKLADARVAAEAVRALAYCAREGPDAIRDAAQLVASEDVGEKLVAAAAALAAAPPRELDAALAAYEADPEDEDSLLFDARAALLRLQALLLHDGGAAGADGVYDALNRLVEGLASGQQLLPPGAVRDALLSTALLLTWRLDGLGASPAPAEAADLSQKASLFVSQLHSLAGITGARVTAAKVLADLYLVFGARGPMGAAAVRPSDEDVEGWWALVERVLEREPAEEGEEAAEPAAAAALEAAKLEVAAGAAQLAHAQAVPQARRVAAHLISHWGDQGESVAEAIRELCRKLKKVDAEALPAIYLDALKLAHARCPPPPGLEEFDDYEDDQERLQAVQDAEQARLAPLILLAQKISQLYMGFNASGPASTFLALEGARHALAGAPEALDFLHAAAFFALRLPAASAGEVAAAVEAAAAPLDPTEEDDAWQLYYEFLAILRERVAKVGGRPAGGEEGRMGRAAGGREGWRLGRQRVAAGGPARVDSAALPLSLLRAGRAFLPQGKPKPALKQARAAAAAPASTGGGGGRQRGSAKQGPRPKRISFAARASDSEAEEEEEEEEEAPPLPAAQRGRRAGPPALPAAGGAPSGGASGGGWRAKKATPRQAAPLSEEQQLLEEEEQEDAARVMPTEEVLPQPRRPPRAPAPQPQSQRQQQQQRGRGRGKLKALLATEEQAEADAEEREAVEESDGDDLPDIRGKGRPQPAAAAAPAQHAVAAEQQQEEEEEEEEESSEDEERPARRRRRR
eukprot:scaffold13.g272.t1